MGFRTIAGSVLVLGAIALASPAWADAKSDLDQLIADVQAFDLSQDPIEAGQEGDLAAAARMPDISPKARSKRNAANAEFAQRLHAIPLDDLEHSDKINAELLAFVLDSRVDRARFDTAAMPYTNDSGFHTALDYLARATQTRNIAQAEAWIARLNAVPAWMDQEQANIAHGLKSGFVQPKMTTEGVVETMQGQLEGDSMLPTLLAPLNALPDSVSPQEKAKLEAGVKSAYAESIKPAWEKMLAFLTDDVVPQSRDSIGIGDPDVPQGQAYYDSRVKYYTTTDMSAQQIHELGLSEVARIRKEMEAVIAETGFKGSFADFLQFLRTDPQFYAKTPKELMMHASYLAKEIDGKMPQFFNHLPRLPYGVKEVPPAIAPHYTTARYWPGDPKHHRAGFYMVNTYDLKSRPLYELPALTLHEAVPGHHHQFAIAQELQNVPQFRKDLYIVAFGEGWGLYSEKIGEDMGMYQTPYEKFGQLTYEMWRACRLVMDTGIHAFGWSKEKAESCLIDNSALSLHNIETETERYISWPGQALGYKMGELTIVRLRKKAKAELGDDFNLSDFHDEVISDGSITLAMLEEKIDAWIAKVKAEKAGEKK